MSIRSAAGLSILLATVAASGCNEASPDNTPGGGDAAVELGSDAGGADGSDVATPDAAPDGDAVTLDVTVVSCSDEDDLHPNHGAASAAVVGSVLERDLYICSGEDDWFAISARAGQTISAEITFASRIGDLDLYLLPAGTEALEDAVAVSGTLEDSEALTYVPDADGTWFVVVDSFEGAEGAYAIEVSVRCRNADDCAAGEVCSLTEGRCAPAVDPTCGQDELEPNADVSSAAVAEFGADGFAYLHGLVVCDEDDDYFEVRLDQPSDLVAQLEFDSGANLDLYVFDSEGRPLASATSTDGRAERIERALSTAGTYFVVVDDYVTGLGGDVGYNLTLQASPRSCATSADCADVDGRALCEEGGCVAFDPEEPSGPAGPCDDDGDCAEGLGCFVGAGGIETSSCTTECGGDADCGYMSEGYCLGLGFTGVCFTACDDDTDCPTSFACGGDGRCGLLECRLDSDCGDGRLCHRSEEQNRGFCTAVAPRGCVGDDAYEPNDTVSAATAVDARSALDGVICATDDDWFAFEVTEDGTALDVSVTFDAAVDIDVYILDSLGRTVGAGIQPDANPEVAVAEYVAAGTYYVRVNLYPGEGASSTTYTIAGGTSSSRCSAAGGECGDLLPVRFTCNAESGACEFFDGGGAVPLGGSCDSSDDCTEDADLCWTREPAATGRNVCTRGCETEADCSDVPDAACVRVGRGFRVCLPG